MEHLRIVDGNTFATSHLIKAVDAQGQEIRDFDLQACTDIKVYYEYKGNYFPVYLWSIDDQRLNIVWKGPSMRLGIYNLYIKGKFHETDWRIADWYTFEVVKYNKDAYIPEDVTILNGTYFVGADFALITLINGGGGGTPSSTLPLMDGVADIGTENAYARGDHRHPSDTNKQDLIDDLEEIRSGAEAGQTAYQKPTNGIPATDLANGVIPDVSQFITKSVNDLVNYYTKNQTYTQAEVNALIAAINQFHYEIAESTSAVVSPASNVLYLIGPTGTGADKYEEYVYTTTWVKIGDTSIDLSGYVTTTALNTALDDYVTSTSLSTTLAGYQTKIDSSHKLDYSLLSNTPTIPDELADLTADSTHRLVTDTEKSTWSSKGTYSKPSGGIPASDLASGVIPTVPTISTDISSDATSDTKTASPKAVKTYADSVKGDTNVIEGIKMNNTALTPDANKVVDLGTVITSHQDISGKADKSEMSISTSSDQTTITLKSGTSATVINSHQSLTGKQDVIDSSHKLSADLVDDTNTTNKFVTASDKTTWNGKQAALVSGTNIKTINNESLLGSGNITIQGGGDAVFIYTVDASSVVPGTETVISGTAAYTAIHAAIEDGKAVYVKWDDGWGDFYPILPYVSELGYGNYSYEFTTSLIMSGNAVSYDVRVGENGIALKNTYTQIAEKVLVDNHGTSNTTYSVTPNTLHIWGTVASLTLTLATPTDATIVNEYMFEFTSGSTATTLSLPASVEWAEPCGALSVEASKTYQVSIVNNIGLWTAIANS